jgi:predicted transcriptional regulator of viral defense system
MIYASKTVYVLRMNRQEALEQISSVAAEQGGLVTSRQALRRGVAHATLAHLADRGLLRRIRRGVYTVAFGRASSPQEDLLGAWLALDGEAFPWERQRPRALISHASAAAVHGLGTIIPTLPELTTERQAGRREGIIAHTAPFGDEDWGWMALADTRAPVTTPARTIIDLWLAREETEYLEQALTQTFPDHEKAHFELLRALRHRRKKVGPDLERDLRRLIAGIR